MQERKVLDHGFVRLLNLAGPTRRIDQMFDASDVDPAQAARMSFNQFDSNRTELDDHKLADYLMRNKHTSPFEMVQVWIEMKLPIFVARQFVRHRTVRLNEVSGRYITLPEEWYIPADVGGKAKSNKQGQSDNLDFDTQSRFKENLSVHCSDGYAQYIQALEEGVAPEHARLFLSVNHYTHWVWNQDLHNLLHFLSLRDHSHAQIEAQKYAQAIDQLLREQLPVSMALYDKYRKLA